MKKFVAVLLILAFASVGAALAQGIALSTTEIRFDNCSGSGSSSQSLAVGSWLMTVSSQEDVFLCYAGTCVSNGKPYAAGFGMLLRIPESGGRTVSCRSASGTGDIHFQKTP